MRGRFIVRYVSGRMEKIFPKDRAHSKKIDHDLKAAKQLGAVDYYRYEGKSKWD